MCVRRIWYLRKFGVLMNLRSITALGRLVSVNRPISTQLFSLSESLSGTLFTYVHLSEPHLLPPRRAPSMICQSCCLFSRERHAVLWTNLAERDSGRL